ncbi:ATP-grasp domain-containing protein, partial [Myxococcota bacterium]|nr:ATP-grasp domain-containing protein [Myxococcota bacterium]
IKHKNQKNILFFNLCESLESNPYMEVEAARLLEDSKIPFTGNGSQPLQYCLDKHLCYQMLSSAKVSVPKTFLIKNVNQIEQLKFIFDENKKYIIKPNTEDGSIGISFSSVVSTYDELIVQATDMLNNMGYDLVVQEFIDGREINLSVLDIKHQLFGYSEVNFDRLDPNLPRILNYSSKWDEESAEYAATKSLAAELESDLKEALLKNARMAHQALNLNAYVRFDFRCTSNNQVYIIDVNPNCDLSETSGFIKSFNFKGLSFIKIIRTIIYSAMNESSLHNNQSVAFDRTASFSTKEYII